MAAAAGAGAGRLLVFQRPRRQRRGDKRGNAAPVRVAVVEQRDMAVVERSLGTVVANTLVQLSARVQGTLESANFKEGQFVKKGDLLFQIDPRPFQAALAQAEAIYARDQAQTEECDARQAALRGAARSRAPSPPSSATPPKPMPMC